jgi:hypothetical protein
MKSSLYVLRCSAPGGGRAPDVFRDLRHNESVPDNQPDARRIRVGLALVTVAFLASIVLVFAVRDPLGRAVMAAIAASALLRGALLVRSLRRSA